MKACDLIVDCERILSEEKPSGFRLAVQVGFCDQAF
jgi:hypothetical protein